MTTSIIGLFEDGDIAGNVLGELAGAGFDKEAMEILQGAPADEISSRLLEAGYDESQARRYADAMQKGGAMVVAETDDDRADDALAVMRRFGALTPEALAERLDARDAERARAEEAEADEEEAEEDEEADYGEAETAQVIEEELEVGKERTTGGKRLKVTVSEREVEQTINLRGESVEVERSRVDRDLTPDELDHAFEERTIEMTETRERPVVAKRAHVVEEVVLTKHSNEHEETVSGTVRRQDVMVEDMGFSGSSQGRSGSVKAATVPGKPAKPSGSKPARPKVREA
ncbi:YsnF/AvaK domain-containing protein (plasmid) [Skermanella mucosa]|uniref:YsnF/AvaK domain-containing protein n=1 Tax=Skermanella mucosa TaxID=1789672 RepID=UPI00192B1465|nr:YsnF/AvaK domain-containing protein [Skermanella mucosa]UEM24948.1 YsnF/AvaK domain-containing protein [Skermanella mucosa]